MKMLFKWRMRKEIFSALGEIHTATLISWLMKTAIFGCTVYFLVHGDFVFFFMSSLAFIVSLLPTFFERSYHVTLPWEIDFVLTLVISLHLIFGDVMDWYDTVPYYDKFLHLFSSGLLAYVSFMIVFALHYSGKVRLSTGLVGFFTVVFTMALGVLWEIGEFIADQLWHVGAQGGLTDTMMDLILDTCGGLLAAVLGSLYVKNLKPIEKRILSVPIAIFWERIKKGARRKKA